MAPPLEKTRQELLAAETGTLRKDWRGRLAVALVYPNTYHVGMSSLGFQSVYRQLNAIEALVCERVFASDKPGPPRALESGNPLSAFDVIAFSISFENDYANVLTLLTRAGLPLRAADRDADHPLVMAGGVTSFLNPEPMARFVDCFLIGEAEGILPAFFEHFDPHTDRRALLRKMAARVPGLYVPACYQAQYAADGSLAAFEAEPGVPPRVRRVYVADLSDTPTCSAIVTSETTFERTFLIEVARGCPHGCRFCSAGYVYRPPRFRPIEALAQTADPKGHGAQRVGLVGAAVSDLPGLDILCDRLRQATASTETVELSFSSLRADALTPDLIAALAQSGVKTATIAPDAGSERMRRVINKGITEEHVLKAADALVAGGILNLKLYFMVGLPTETEDDVEAVVHLCRRIKHTFLQASRGRGRIGEITVSLNAFIPKPFTPFQWSPMETVTRLKAKIKKVKAGLKRVPNVRVHADVPRWAYVQALLSRGDRRVGRILAAAHAHRGNWAQTFKTSVLNPDFYVHRQRPFEELLPWDFIDHGLDPAFLQAEYRRALQGRTTPDCQVGTCRACGVCRTDA